MFKAPFLTVTVAVVLGLVGLFLALRPAPERADPRERTVDLEVRGGTASPAEIAVTEGDRVTLGVTADRPMEFHLHGYDLEGEVSPDEPSTVSFEADLTGRFEIEDHGTEAALGTLVVEPRQGG